MRKKVLVVDDDKLALRLLADQLREEGYSVITAENGEKAIERAVCEKPDVIFMDIMLPDMPGAEAVKQMQDKTSDDLNIIFLSGVVLQSDDVDQTVQVGGKYYPAIPKPIDLDRLLKML